MSKKIFTLEEVIPCAVIKVFDLNWFDDPEDAGDHIDTIPKYKGLVSMISYTMQTGRWQAVDAEFDNIVTRTAEENRKSSICDMCVHTDKYEDSKGSYVVPCPKILAPELFKEEDGE